MSATQAGFGTTEPREGRPLGLSGANIFAVSVAMPVMAGLAWIVSRQSRTIITEWKPALVWLLAIGLLNLLDIRNLYGLKLAPDVPLTAAVAIFFVPGAAGVIAFLGSCDPRELKGEIRLVTTLFNRSQIALSVYLASQTAHAIGNPNTSVPSLVVLTLVALGTSLGSNYVLVGVMSSLINHVGAIRVLTRMQLGRPADFGATILAWGMMAFMLSAAYQVVSWWAVVAFCIPSVLGRQVLDRSQQLMRSQAAIAAKEETVRELSERMAFERRDERFMISSHLHDEILQPLFRVSLLCSVVHEDLSSGMLLALEDDVPALRKACEHASSLLRRLIRDLRSSPLGSRGLSESISSLLRELQSRSQAKIASTLKDVGSPDELTQLAVYQVVKEALLNAVHHAQARHVSVELWRDEDFVRVSVEDDGIGFDPQSSRVGHFGLLIMKERAEATGGIVYVDTAPGEGTIVAGRFPLD